MVTHVETDHDVAVLDVQRGDVPDVQSGDAHLVPGLDARRVGEFGKVSRLGEQLRQAGEGLANRHDQNQDDDAHQAVTDPVGTLQ